MEIITRGKLRAALFEEEDLGQAKAAPEKFIQSAIDQGCTGFIIPGRLIKKALPLMKSGLLDALRKRFAHASFRAAVVNMPGGLIASAVKVLVKAYGVDDSVFFADNMGEALDALASVPPAGRTT
ncbi:MAG: hypothetical protein PHP02_03735 [Eubacteriales bacterium]|nr:hypothetical protein [Eubacteriales bacterium]